MNSEFTRRTPRPWLLLMIALIAGCAGFTRGEQWVDEDVDAPPAGPEDTSAGGTNSTYSGDIHDLLLDGCERCHSPDGAANGTAFIILANDIEASYSSVIEFVDVDAPSSSRLLSKAAGMGHGGGTIFDTRSAEYAEILAWIEQGALP